MHIVYGGLFSSLLYPLPRLPTQHSLGQKRQAPLAYISTIIFSICVQLRIQKLKD